MLVLQASKYAATARQMRVSTAYGLERWPRPRDHCSEYGFEIFGNVLNNIHQRIFFYFGDQLDKELKIEPKKGTRKNGSEGTIYKNSPVRKAVT